MTASGMDVNKDSPFYGPHVGSYYNMLFKRALLGAKCPTVLFLDDEKLLENPFKEDFCYPVCDGQGPLSWAELCHQSPLAIALGCATEDSRRKSAELLTSMGLTEIKKNEKPSDDGAWPIIASNKAFFELWGSS
jgi:hypothetical protein